MFVILFGAPGVGKGTQAKIISSHYHIPHISTGEILRSAVSEGTELGKKAEEIISIGNFVPDDIMLGIIKERISCDDCQHGFILDGFPRTTIQAENLDHLWEELNLPELVCIEIVAPDEALINRLINRRVCHSCGTDYNLISNPPQSDMKCTICNGKIIHRKDDNHKTIADRLKIYQKETAPLRDYYSGHGHYYKINGSQSINVVKSEIYAILERKRLS